MSGTRVHDHYEDPSDFALVLEAADKAHTKDPKARSFVEETKDRFNTYGQGMFLSERQKDWLERIAEDVR